MASVAWNSIPIGKRVLIEINFKFRQNIWQGSLMETDFKFQWPLSLSQIDGMLQEFADINRGMEKTGTFTMDKKKLLQLVGKANSNLADVILKVGLFER